ncbi:hypothetical protein L6452_15601 [Arctium lappa]|uniref:Uncharacterized protein n=1 Tax=Arctium lappa TaxID=4217 RepID=A0ACB9CP55_ARCLA|nr:hypothetical protein L6452_15601 [Arctium lappa]
MEKRFSFFFIFFTVFLYVISSVAVADSCTLSNASSIIIVSEVTNGMRHGAPLCESKDSKIHGKDLEYNKSIAWNFCANQKTYFQCKFYMGVHKYQNFVVYDHNIGDQCEESPKRDCRRCTWLIRDDGFYFVNRKKGRQDIKKYDWKDKRYPGKITPPATGP